MQWRSKIVVTNETGGVAQRVTTQETYPDRMMGSLLAEDIRALCRVLVHQTNDPACLVQIRMERQPSPQRNTSPPEA